MKLRFIRDCMHHGVPYKVGDVKDYYPWDCEWQGMTEPARVTEGIFIECHGHGEFDVFRLDDVEVEEEK